MKITSKKTVNTGIIIALFSLFTIACNKNENVENKQLNAELTNYSSCKRNKSLTADEIPNTQSCIKYSYNESTKKLSIQHINAGFNCNIDGIGCNVSLKANTLTFEEYETGLNAKCNCIYDIDIEVNNLEKNSYTLKFIEPLIDVENRISFIIDLTSNTEGSYCVTRNNYPWAN